MGLNALVRNNPLVPMVLCDIFCPPVSSGGLEDGFYSSGSKIYMFRRMLFQGILSLLSLLARSARAMYHVR